MTGSQQNTTSSLPHTDQVACRGGTQDAVLADKKLLDTIGGTDLCDLLNNLWIVEAAIASDD